MKKLIIVSFLFFSFPSVFAFTCTDLKTNLKRGGESKDVLLLQQFLYEKKLLTATPNGYFGPGTQRAVQAYQKSVGLTNSGAVLALTRAKIKSETCGVQSGASPTVSGVGTTTTISKPSTPKSKTGPAPIITSVDKAVVLLDGKTEWSIIVRGSNFSSSTNTVYLTRRDFSKRYTIGTFPSADGRSIALPKSLGMLTFPCGPNCRQKLQEGEYFVVVETEEGGEGQINEYVLVKDSSITSSSVSQSAVPYAATNTRVGAFTFKANTPLSISLITFNVNQGKDAPVSISNVVFKDERSGKILENAGAGTSLYEGEFKHVGIYANVYSTKSVQAATSFTVSVLDILNNNKVSTFTSASTTISFEGEPVAIAEARRLAAISPAKVTKVDQTKVLAGGDTTWSVVVTGSDFATTTNTVYMKARVGGRKYKIGTIASGNNRTTITLPSGLGNKVFSCGNGCEEKLLVGEYDLTVDNGFGESLPYLLTVYGFNISSRSGTESQAIEPKATKARMGTVTFGSNTNLTISAIRFSFSLYKNTSTISGTILKDELTGQTLSAGGKDIPIYSSGTKIIGVYSDVTTTAATGGTGYFNVDIADPVTGKITTFTTPKFEVTLASY